jgi:hypothetical protein
MHGCLLGLHSGLHPPPGTIFRSGKSPEFKAFVAEAGIPFFIVWIIRMGIGK